MTRQPEAILESSLIGQLVSLGYEKITLPNEDVVIDNLKVQLEKHNNKTFSDYEFTQILFFQVIPIFL